MAWLWSQTATILALITSCYVTPLHGEVIVNVTDTARFSFEVTSENDFLFAPNGDLIAQKTGDSCSLKIKSETDRYQLKGTDCATYLNILLTKVTLQDAGIYKTSVSKSNVKLIVLESPEKPNITADKQSYKAGDDLTLFCKTVSKSRPIDHGIAMVYQWYRAGIRTADSGASILLTNLQAPDFNITYNCIVKNVNGPISTESYPFYLLFKFKGSIRMSINDIEDGVVEVKLNDPLVFRFTAIAYPLFTHILFRRNNINIETLHAPNYTKVIRAQCIDNAFFLGVNYYNTVEVASNKITVRIPCPPTFQFNAPDPYILYASPVLEKELDIYIVSYTQFTCQVQRETESGLIPLSPLHDVFVAPTYCAVHFRNLDERLYGKYKVMVQNDMGNFTGNVLLTGPPSEPKNLMAWSTTPNSVYLSWESGDNYGLVPIYRVLFKIKNGGWKEYSQRPEQVIIIIKSLLSETKYSFLVQASTNRDEYGFFSNPASTTTIGINDEPQPRPETPDQTSTEIPAHKTSSESNLNQSRSQETTPMCQSETLPTGVAIGLAVGVAVAIMAIIVTVIFFKRKYALNVAPPPPLSRQDQHSNQTISSHYDQLNDSVQLQRGYQELGGNASQYSAGLSTYLRAYNEPLDAAIITTSATDAGHL